MSENKNHKPLKVEFAPGCFDHLDVENQEELDAVMAEITTMFENMTHEELQAQSRPVDWDNLDEEERAILEQAFNDHDDADSRKNRLQ